METANDIACKIYNRPRLIIVSVRSKRLAKSAHGSAKDLWAQVMKVKVMNKPLLIDGNAINANQPNQYYADVSTD